MAAQNTLIPQNSSYNLMVFMVDSGDHLSGKTGLTLTLTASKAGAAFASISPTVTERGNGWYSLALTSSHTNTLGDLALHITGTGADPNDSKGQVVYSLPGSLASSEKTSLPDYIWGASRTVNTEASPWGAGTFGEYVLADSVRISGDATAANVLETMLDGTGGQVLSLGQLVIAPSTGVAVDISSPDDYAISVTADTGDAVVISSAAGNGDAIQLNPNGTGFGIRGTLSGGGAGAYPITVTVDDGATALQNATVRVSSGVTSHTVTTDASGNGTFSLDAGTYTVTITKSGYTFTSTTRTVTGSQTGTLVNALSMTAVVTPTSSDPNLCTVSGYLRNAQGVLSSGKSITFTLVPSTPIKGGGGDIIATREVTMTSNGAGLFSGDLYRNDLATPPGTRWRVTSDDIGLREADGAYIYLNAASLDLRTADLFFRR